MRHDTSTFNKKRPTKNTGFTLIEALLAASLFSLVGMMATGIFVNMNRTKQEITSRNFIYDDAQAILDQLSRLVKTNTIDYEEYYNQTIENPTTPVPGTNFGYYASKFYDGDINTGKNPATGNFPESSNAFYQSGTQLSPTIFCEKFKSSVSPTKNHVCVTRLFLISGDAKRKTMIAPIKIDWNTQGKTAILGQSSMVQAEKTGAGGAKELLPGIYTCANSDKECTNKCSVTPKNMPDGNVTPLTIYYPTMPTDAATDLVQFYTTSKSGFAPITPSRINIKDVKFIISPVEDPYKAFGETSQDFGADTNIFSPVVTIVLTVEPKTNVTSSTKIPPLTVSIKVTPGAANEVQSYPPHMNENQCAP